MILVLNIFMNGNHQLHPDLIAARDLIYNSCGFKCSQPLMERESAEYGAYIFELNGLTIRFRVSKITPTKTGQFVTFWKREGNGPIQPYDISDPFDFLIVSTRKDDRFGQFVFSKSALYERGVISRNEEGGKRALRVYPPWDHSLNRQAKNTQEWQIEYFLEVPLNKSLDVSRAKVLYSGIESYKE